MTRTEAAAIAGVPSGGARLRHRGAPLRASGRDKGAAQIDPAHDRAVKRTSSSHPMAVSCPQAGTGQPIGGPRKAHAMESLRTLGVSVLPPKALVMRAEAPE